MRDTDVEVTGDALKGIHILLGVTGGIAAVDTVRLARELRRHGANLTVIMTKSAQEIITPLAVRWASQGQVITDWDGDLSSLENFDAILVTPATRNIMASFAHGLMNGPLLMALSAANSRNCPIMMIPSMHIDIAEDPVTIDVVSQCSNLGVKILWGEEEEGKMKNLNHVEIVARFSNYFNSNRGINSGLGPHQVVITLGATKSHIDDIRFVQNTSSGATGFAIADYLYRLGMDITCVAGETTVNAPPWLPLVIKCPDPEDMLKELIALSKDNIEVWIHTAAVLDYIVSNPIEGKIASLQGDLNFNMTEGKKHIMELAERCKGSIRIGFKLESGIKQKDIVHRAFAQIKKCGMTVTIANRLEDLDQKDKPRGWLVDEEGVSYTLHTEKDMLDAILTTIKTG